MLGGQWEPTSRAPALAHGDVHVWRARLDLADDAVCRLRALLTNDERKRTDRYVLPHDRRRAVVARGTMRRLLSDYVGKNPADLRFVIGTHGKPHLADGEVEFGLTHSEDLMVLAVSHGRPLGVDVERLRVFYPEEVVHRAFSSREISSLAALPEAVRLEAFYACWTRKEAYLKAIGLGLSKPLDSFTVTLAPGQAPAIVEVEGDPAEAARWSLHSFCPASDFSGAMAILGPALPRFFDLSPQD